MTRSLSALTAALPLLTLALPVAAAAEEPLLGFGVEELAQFAVDSPVRATLSDGKVVGHDGRWVRRFKADGSIIGALGPFPSDGVAGFILVDDSETFVVVSQSDTGLVYRMEIDGSGTTPLANVPGGFDAAWESSSSILISGDLLTRLDLVTGSTTVLADLGGLPGPVEVAPDGSVFVGTRSDQTPIPAGSSAVYRFDAATLANPPAAGYVEKNGLVVIEVESTPPTDQWVFENSKTGFAGDGYYRWDGPNYFSSPGAGILSYQFEITTGGRYDFVIHNRHDHPESDKENDTWVRVDGGSWFKCFSNGGWQNIGVWNWLSWFDYSGSLPNEQAYFDLTPGVHTLEFSARSYNFHIDRFHLYLDTLPNPWDSSIPETVSTGLGVADATFVIGGFTDAQDLLLNDGTDLLVADTDPIKGSGRIMFAPGLGLALTLVTSEAGERIDELEFEPGPGPATFQAFQPADGGELRYLSIDPSGVVERNVLTPDRMDLELTGPGTLGNGTVTATVKGGIFGASAVIVWGPAIYASSTEVPVPGLAQLLTPLHLPSLQVGTGLLPFDLAGETAVNFFNPTGLTDIVVMQALLWSPNIGAFVATSTPATL